jgi:hypothetical protein
MRTRVSLAANGPAAAAVAVLGHLCTAHALLAQESVTIDVQECVKLESPRERFDCYERHADEASTQKAAAHAAPAPASPAAPAAVPTTAAAVAVTAPPPAASVQPPPTPAAQATPSSSAGKAAEPSPEPQEVVATITAVRETVPSSYVITLDNGQVWSQSYPEPYGLLRPGQRVTLRASKWGTSYHLSVEGQNGFIQVKRVQ